MRFKKARLFMAVLSLAVLPFSDLWADDRFNQNLNAERRLNEMQQAFRSSNFELYFVKQTMAASEPVSFSHGVIDGRQYSHWLYLNGMPMGYFSAEGIMAYFRAGSQPEIINNGKHPFLLGRFNTVSTDRILKNYVPVVTGRNRIAGRDVFMVRLSPKKNDRYGYVLYVDEITNILLQIDVVNPLDGSLMESYLATHFIYTESPNRIIQNINEAYLKESAQSFEQSGTAIEDGVAVTDKDSEHKNSLNWEPAYIPSGFEMVQCEKYSMPGSETDVEHLLFTDGITDFSVYRIQALEGSDFPVVKQGTTNLLRYKAPPYEIVVVGDILMDTEDKIAKSYSEIKK